MILKELRLRGFRNFSRLDWTVGPGVHVLTGLNGQGKTNILEAVYLLSTMRSFRGARHQELIQYGKSGYFAGGVVQADVETRIKFYRSRSERKLSVNEEPLSSLQDYLGTVRTVIFSSEDIQLVKGPASVRRRFLDLICCQTRPGYLEALQKYSRAVRNRNALLKRKDLDDRLLQSFTAPVIEHGNRIMEIRRKVVPALSPIARLAYRQIADGRDEELLLEYRASVKHDFALELEKNFRRELSTGSTIIGPHRDDLILNINDRDAARFASEGQQRTLVIALKMAQIQILFGYFGSYPILLIDDIMGELDAGRRKAFLPLLDKARDGRAQIIMTCTEPSWPESLSASWIFWDVHNGHISRIRK